MCVLCSPFSILTSNQAAALDLITGGFTIVFHTHGTILPSALSALPEPEEMQFGAYLTHSEVETFRHQFDAPIAQMAQIFAAQVMPLHSSNYIDRCIASRVNADIVLAPMLQPDAPVCLIAAPEAESSKYAFSGYHPGYLESLLLQRVSSCMRAAHLKPQAVVSRAPTATPLGYLPSPGISHQPRPTPHAFTI